MGTLGGWPHILCLTTSYKTNNDEVAVAFSDTGVERVVRTTQSELCIGQDGQTLYKHALSRPRSKKKLRSPKLAHSGFNPRVE